MRKNPIRRITRLQIAMFTMAILPLWLSAQQPAHPPFPSGEPALPSIRPQIPPGEPASQSIRPPSPPIFPPRQPIPQLTAPPSQLQITPGGHLVMRGPVSLVLNDIGFTDNGDFSADISNVRFTGETGALINSIKGSSAITFYHLTIQTGPSSGALLWQSITVTGNLNMQTGPLMLNGNNISLTGAGRIVGESNDSYIQDVSPGTGSVSVTTKLFAPLAVNPGNIGVEITSNASLGSTRIVRHFDPQTFNGGGSGIARWFSISPSGNAGLDATVRVHYLDNELGANNPSALDIWEGSDIMYAWIDVGKTNADLTARWIQMDDIDHFNRLTLGNAGGGGGAPLRSAPRPQATTAMQMDPSLSDASVRIGLYPNPTHDQSVLTITSPKEKDVLIGLYDQKGQLLQRRMVHLTTGSNTLTWNLGAYPAGVYYLVPDNEAFKKVKIVKQ